MSEMQEDAGLPDSGLSSSVSVSSSIVSSSIVSWPLNREPQAQNGPSTDRSQSSSSMVPSAPPVVAFDRFELRELLNLYGRMVASGEWRDYAMDFTKDLAVFSVFRRAHDVPLYRIEKNPKLARKQGQYVLKGTAGQVLKRGHELSLVLRVLDKPVKLVVA